MLIVKDGISREIDKSRLQEYKDKGYVVYSIPEKPKPKKEEKK